MSKINISLCALALSMVSAYSFAATPVTQGTVTFTGKLIADTCSIVSGDEDKKVTLPTLSTQTLNTAGAVGGTTTFNLSVESCPVGVTQVAAHFEAINSDGFNAATQNLTNSTDKASGGAENVEIRLFDRDGVTQIPVGGTGSLFDVDSTTNKATMTYIGGYYAAAATTAGNVTAKVQYTLAYK
ncbi:fimbrial protein [Lelliottia amnigena]|uniref:Fimbrial protein n=1 Tax=Lelliottia amnigena TaxID=61646 RepID=A0ABU7UGJ1_LELAM